MKTLEIDGLKVRVQIWWVHAAAAGWRRAAGVRHRVSSSVQGHGGSGTISDHHQTVLQARAGDLSAHCHRHGWQVDSLTPLCVQGIIFVYDVTNQPSFQHITKWVSDVDEVGVVWLIQPSHEIWSTFVMRFGCLIERSEHGAEDPGGKQMWRRIREAGDKRERKQGLIAHIWTLFN